MDIKDISSLNLWKKFKVWQVKERKILAVAEYIKYDK